MSLRTGNLPIFKSCRAVRENATGSGPVKQVKPAKGARYAKPAKCAKYAKYAKAAKSLSWSKLSGVRFFEQ